MTEEVPEHEEVDTESPENSQFEDELRGHAYDGIHEYDNPSPQWFNALFLASIAWGVLYCFGMWLDFMPGWHETHQDSMEKLRATRAAAQEGQESIDASTLEEAAGSDDRVAAGKKVFAANCSRCHGDAGGGEIGPNLTDKYWIHEGSLTSIYGVIKNGVSGAGMPAWSSQLTQEKMVAVTAYVRSLKGTNPPDPKEPEGEKWTPEGGD